MKKIIYGLLFLSTFLLAINSVFAMGRDDNAMILSELTNKSVDKINSIDKKYHEIATDAGVYDEFMAAKKEAKISRINSAVESGKLTKEEADSMISKVNSGECVKMQLKNR